ncbi:MAG: phage tail protein [Hyphomonas sp.]|uniref:phage tail protein n=1 Tax=Hyphomonas sp. TaxID=87 RepID=UPI001D229422|nr:tail fiber protein [Hyphomonas sp.]MBA4008151.1 phage tail protein [Erythrobacter sp.]MBA4079930.1 phage tail protein [Erythrobacter sp.]MBA4165699.1 phage tail protein [Erythrobacter sp.]MBA4228890.1 phage tail protein [Hyphomonas sp.]
MSNAFIGEIRLFAGNFAPVGWAFCDGSLISIEENNALFALIGTNYGGNGQTTFALPDLRSRVPLHQGPGPGLSINYVVGEAIGTEQVTLSSNNMPAHQHSVIATTATGSVTTPGPTVMLATPVEAGVATSLYVVPGSSTVNQAPMAAQSIGSTGGGQPHENMMPFQAINYIIALFGVFPTRA